MRVLEEEKIKEETVVCNCGIEHTSFCVDCNTDIMLKARRDALDSLLKIAEQYEGNHIPIDSIRKWIAELKGERE